MRRPTLVLLWLLPMACGGDSPPSSPVSPSAPSTPLIVNGSFEQGCGDPGPTWIRLDPGSNCLPGWTVIAANIHYCGIGLWDVSHGARNLDLDGDSGFAGGVSQTFATVRGATYSVTFDMAGNPGNLPAIKPMRVSADGQSSVFNFDVTGRSLRNMGWITVSWSFVADDTSATLEFLSLTTTVKGWGPTLDNVIVTRR